MTDTRFYGMAKSFSLEELQETFKDSIEIISSYSLKDIVISSVNGLKDAKTGDLSFISNDPNYLKYLDNTQVSILICTRTLYETKNLTQEAIILHENPYFLFDQIIRKLFPEKRSYCNSQPKNYSAGENLIIEEGVRIGQNVIIGHDCYIGANSVIGDNVILGNNVSIYPNVTIMYSIIGNNVTIASNTAIGQRGYGYVKYQNCHNPIHHIGRIIIEDNVEIHAQVSLDRGSLGDTIISQGTKIGTLATVGHNVQIGQHNLLLPMSGIAGSAMLKNWVTIAAQSGVLGHITIEDHAILLAKSFASKNLKAHSISFGSPAKDRAIYNRDQIMIKKMVSEYAESRKNSENSNNS